MSDDWLRFAVGVTVSAPKKIDWSAQPLGREPDTVIARKLGMCVSSVRRARWSREIPAAPPVSNTSSSLLKDEISKPETRSRSPWDLEPELGVVPDRELAGKHGVSADAIRAARFRRKIPSVRPYSNWEKDPKLGKMFDSELAELRGISISAVTSARRRRGVPAYCDMRRCECGGTFQARRRDQMWCNEHCRTVREEKNRAAENEKERARLRARALRDKERRARQKRKRAERPPEMRTCECGAEFVVKKPDQAWCNEHCRKVREGARRAGVTPVEYATRMWAQRRMEVGA